MGSSGAVAGDGDPLVVFMTGLSGCRGFAARRPADVANSLSFCDKPVCCLFGAAITWGSWLGVMYLQKKIFLRLN